MDKTCTDRGGWSIVAADYHGDPLLEELVQRLLSQGLILLLLFLLA